MKLLWKLIPSQLTVGRPRSFQKPPSCFACQILKLEIKTAEKEIERREKTNKHSVEVLMDCIIISVVHANFYGHSPSQLAFITSLANKRASLFPMVEHCPVMGNLSVLLLDDNPISLQIITNMLVESGFKVFPFQTMVMALDFVNSRAAIEEDLNLVLAEAHLRNIAPGFLANFELLHLILNELQVLLITICAYDDVEAVSKLALGACFNLLKPLHTGSLNMLKTKALEHKPRKATPQGPILSRTKSRMVSSPTKRPQEMLILERNNLSNPESNEFQVPEVRKAHGCSKKPDRVQWIHELQEKFLDAVKVLRDKYATPQGIRKLMNVNGLTSKHIASHLQKHRLQQQKAKQGGQNQMNASTKSVSELIGLAHNAAITESIIPRVDADIEGVYPSRLWMHMSERPVTEAVASKTYTYTCTSGVYRDETKSVWDEYEKGLQEEFSASNRHWQQIGLPSSKRKLPAKNNVVVIDRSVSSGAPKAAGNNGNVGKINLLKGIEAASNNDSVGNINLPEGTMNKEHAAALDLSDVWASLMSDDLSPTDVREEEISRWMSLLEGSRPAKPLPGGSDAGRHYREHRHRWINGSRSHRSECSG